jgi:hypothetical protein
MRPYRFKNHAQSFIIQFGTSVLPMFTQFFQTMAGSFQHWTEWMQKHPKAMKNIVDGIAVLGAAFAGISVIAFPIGTIAKIAQFAAMFAEGGALAGVAESAGTIMALLAGPVGLIPALSAGVVALILFRKQWGEALGRAIRAIVDGWGPFWAKVWKGIQAYWNHPKTAVIQVAQGYVALGGGTGKASDPFKAVMNGGVLWVNNSWLADIVESIIKGYAEGGPTVPPAHNAQTHVHNLHVDGKKFATFVTKAKNRSMRPAIHATTHGQGTSYVTPFEVLDSLHSPRVR